MKRSMSFSWLATVGLLAGCSADEEANHKTVSWYVEHPQERNQTIAWCRDDVVRMKNPDCMNAATAQQKSWLDSDKGYKSKM